VPNPDVGARPLVALADALPCNGLHGLATTTATSSQHRDVKPSNILLAHNDFALACVLYQCLTGELPFPGDTLEQVAVSHTVMPPPKPSKDRDIVPTAMDQVIATGLAKAPTDRRFPAGGGEDPLGQRSGSRPSRHRPADGRVIGDAPRRPL
jgi:serine/threonine protein kinase